MEQFRSWAKAKWEAARASLWFIPTVAVIGVGWLAIFLLWLDRQLAGIIASDYPWLFSGSPGAARSLLSTIASASITVISIAFSLTIIAIQQASTQYTPRVLQTFTSDRGNKIVLGAYIATFVYALLVLRSVRDAENGVGGFVPSIAASVAILLALICVGLLIYFINHIAFSLQASTIISRVHGELLRQIDHLYPEPIGEPLAKESSKRSLLQGSKHEIKSKKGGFIALINEDGLTDIDLRKARALHVLPKVGDFVVHGQVIAEVIDMPDLPPDIDSKVRQAIVIDARRSARQDPLYAVRQLVDMALKGLSPGINDMTTANYCIRFLGDALGRLANRQFPSSYRQFKDGECVLYLNKPTWDEFVEGAFYEVIHEAEGKVQVTKIILETIHRLAHELPNEERARPLRKLVDHIEALILHTSYISVDKKYLEKRICSVRQSLNEIG